MKLGIREIYEAARAAGFTPDQATTWTAIALAESGGQTGAHNPTGEDSRGLWQINIAPHVRTNVWGDLSDPYVNARAAYDISNHGRDMRPWTTTHASHAGTSTDYRTYLPEVSAVTGYAGDSRGVEGYGSPLADPLPASTPTTTAGTTSYDAIDLGRQPGSDLDTDRDGLTDAFERLAGSSPDVADTDQDGLSDAYEVGVSHSSVLLADSDADGVTDATEVATGTAPAPPVPAGVPGSSPGVAPAAAFAPAVPSAATGAPASRADAFVDAAIAQRGDRYVFGSEAGLDDPDPDAFDCSELTQWAADQVGVTIPDGATYQYLDLKAKGHLLPVEEALHTKGALLFYFSSEPTAAGGRPSSAHVAISLGDGKTIEARGTSYGVNEFGGAGRFNRAGVIPEMADAVGATSTAPSYEQIDAGMAPAQLGDSDEDGLTDVFERSQGFDPFSADGDRDGTSDAAELVAGSDPRVPEVAGVVTAAAMTGLDPAGDEDADGLSNAYEVARGLDPRLADSDQDGLSDATEIAVGTSPTSVDTDADGFTDPGELRLGTDPLGAGVGGPDPLDGVTGPMFSDLDAADGDTDVG